MMRTSEPGHSPYRRKLIATFELGRVDQSAREILPRVIFRLFQVREDRQLEPRHQAGRQ